jgi:hypothetical protein
MCESIPVEKSEDAEWSLFGMSVNIPSALGAILCPAVDVETFEVCFAISLCGSLPSIAFGMNGDILGVRYSIICCDWHKSNIKITHVHMRILLYSVSLPSLSLLLQL